MDATMLYKLHAQTALKKDLDNNLHKGHLFLM